MQNSLPVTFSEQAQEEIKNIFTQKKVPSEYGLRLTVNGGGCAGVDFKIGFDKKNDEDVIYQDYGFDVFISKKDFMHLIGKHVSFAETSEQRGFVFEDQK